MGRPRKDAEEQAEPQEEKASGKTKKVTYNGPEGQVNWAAGGKLIPGEEYDLPVELADGLVAGSPFWE